jgi:phosphate transport system permease protein
VSVVFICLLLAWGATYLWASGRASKAGRLGSVLHSSPSYHGYFAVLAAAGPALLAWVIMELAGAADILVLAATLFSGAMGIWFARSRHISSFRARNRVEQIVEYLMAFVSFIAVITTFSIFIALVAESVRFFSQVPVWDFLFGLQWSPQTAIREGQIGAQGAFGAIPLLAGTLLVTLVAMATAVPLGVLSAIYLSEYAGKRVHTLVKPVLELLAGVPTVVYGFFALLVVGPAVADGTYFVTRLLGHPYRPPAQNALAAGLVMGVMIIPFISSLADDIISAIPRSLEEGALAVGARKSEAIMDVILPAAAPGLVGAFLLAISRAIGETMIVVMAASRSANLTGNPFERVTTITVQIVALLTGDQEFDSPKTLSAFALGLVLFLTTLAINIVALMVVKRYRTRYD